MKSMEYGLLTEAGIDFGDGNIVREGLLLEMAQNAKSIVEEEDYDKLDNFLTMAESRLSKEEYRSLLGIGVRENGPGNILEELLLLEVMKPRSLDW